MKGEIKFFDELRGFGFICPDAGGPDLFFHAKNARGNDELLIKGAEVEFEEAPSKRRDGVEAVAVRVVDDPAVPAA